MKLTILSPLSEKIYDVQMIEAFTADGSYTILDQHAPVLLILVPEKPFEFTTAYNKATESLNLPYGGILKITRDSAILLTR